jgi:hypothetical protein
MQNEMLTIAEYAARIGKAPRSVRQKCLLGTLPGAVKIGRDWLIPSEAPYQDRRVKTGEYKDWRKKR